ncbi:hypothetical protein JCM8097_008391 [Rhodosporidiobolus ruineniae]
MSSPFSHPSAKDLVNHPLATPPRAAEHAATGRPRAPFHREQVPRAASYNPPLVVEAPAQVVGSPAWHKQRQRKRQEEEERKKLEEAKKLEEERQEAAAKEDSWKDWSIKASKATVAVTVAAAGAGAVATSVVDSPSSKGIASAAAAAAAAAAANVEKLVNAGLSDAKRRSEKLAERERKTKRKEELDKQQKELEKRSASDATDGHLLPPFAYSDADFPPLGSPSSRRNSSRRDAPPSSSAQNAFKAADALERANSEAPSVDRSGSGSGKEGEKGKGEGEEQKQ